MEKFKVHQMYFLFILIMGIFLIAGCDGDWLPPDVIDTSAPTVMSTSPGNDAVDVPLNQAISAGFSEAMDPSTITDETFTVTGPGATPVAGDVTYSGINAVFTPDIDLDPYTEYTATITTGATDLAGNALASDYVWRFTTGSVPDTTAPMVIGTINADHATGVAINTKLGATFSEAMNPLTITDETFTVTGPGATPVAGDVAYSDINAVFTPDSDFEHSTTYTGTITTGAEDLAGNALASDYVWSFTTGTAPDTTAPTVNSTDPAAATTGVATNKKVTATFSEAMDPSTITTTTFTLKNGATTVDGTVVYVSRTATFTPTSDLAADTTYTATITTGAKDLAGNALASDYVWSFTTGAAPDTTAPTVVLTDPVDDATGVAINKKIAATFSEKMDPLTITTATFILSSYDGAVVVDGTVVYVDRIATFRPASDLAAGTTYTATITTGAEDLAGNALASDYVWSFTTGTALDTTPPTVTSTSPDNTATDVVLSKKVQATFSEEMDPLTITTATFTLYDGATAVPGTVSYVGLVATFTPTNPLTEDTTYTATITTAAKDLAGNALASDYVWSFTTVAVLPQGPLPVDLGTAANFVILGKSGITTTGATDITGNIGVSPIDSTAITGFGLMLDGSGQFSTSSLVTGNIYAADYAVPTPANMTTAISDMETAYIDAAGRSIPDFTELYAGDISGQTLVPGLYKWSTGVLITNAGVILSGGADDVWIFQIAQDLTVNDNAIVTLSGGAQAKNIFWQVGGLTGVAIGTGCAVEGNILAANAITINTGSSLNGRALAQKNVTLNANIITAP